MRHLLCILFIFCTGCAGKAPFQISDDLQPVPFSDPAFDLPEFNPVRVVEVTDFFTVGFSLDHVPDGLLVDIELTQPVTLPEFFQMLISQNINIVGDITPESSKLISMPFFRGELRDLLKSVQLSHGLFFSYENGSLIVRETSPAYVKVIMPGIQEDLIKLLASFGISNAFYDQLSSRIVFNTDYYKYKSISDYFRDNGYLTLAFFDVMILENEDSDNFEHGFDWSALSLALSDFGRIPLSADVSGSDGSFSLNFSDDNFNLTSFFRSLDDSSSFKILQSARISALNGSACTLDVSEKIPYVSSISLSTISTSDEVSQNYDFDTVSSGLVINLTPTITGDLISLNFSAKIQSVNDFLEVGTQDNLIQQPVVSTRNVSNQVVFKAGDVSLIGGLKYTKGSFDRSSLSFFKNGLQIKGRREFYISIILKSEVVRYVFT